MVVTASVSTDRDLELEGIDKVVAAEVVFTGPLADEAGEAGVAIDGATLIEEDDGLVLSTFSTLLTSSAVVSFSSGAEMSTAVDTTDDCLDNVSTTSSSSSSSSSPLAICS